MRNGGGIPTRHLADGKIPGPTLHNYLESEGFRRGFNDRSIFWHPEHDVGDLTYVNNNYLDGEEDEVTWATDTINKHFNCKDLEWVPMDGVPIDYLGMLKSMDSERKFLEMYDIVYINNALEIMEWSHLKPVSRPRALSYSIDIDGESPKLSFESAKHFHIGLGMVGWLNMAYRSDAAHAYSRLGQNQANPTESAIDALQHCYRYRIDSKNWGYQALCTNLIRFYRNLSLLI